MEQHQLKHIYSFRVDAITNTQRAEHIQQLLRTALEHAPGWQRIETNAQERTLTIRSSEELDINSITNQLQAHGFHLQPVEDAAKEETANGTMSVCVEGMTCHSCELTVERKWKKIPGIEHIDISAANGRAKISYSGSEPSIIQLQEALGEGKYIVSLRGTGTSSTRPSFWQLIGLFALVLLLGKILSSLGLLKASASIGSGMSLGAIFFLGLVAASSSCIAVAGGLLLSAANTFNERYGATTPATRMQPVVIFVLGRVLGYGLFGGLLGVIGKTLSPSPLVTATITIIAAIYMLVMGLDMLQLAPTWLKQLMPKMPKALSHRVMDAESTPHPLAPLGLGAATFFLPCGFTQALQLYALTTGSFLTSATTLLAFAVGTAPALLALGWASSSLKGKAGRFFFRFSGALVIVLGLWNIQNGFAIAGVSLPSLNTSTPTPGVAQNANDAQATDLVPIENGVQVIRMKVGSGYEPNHFTLRAGIPARWEIDATNGGGCASVLISRPLGIQKLLAQSPSNVIEFTPKVTGNVPFSCSMGMYRGSFTILPAT